MVTRVPNDACIEQEKIAAGGVVERRGIVIVRVDIDIFHSQANVERKIGGQAATDGNTASKSLLIPILVSTIKQIAGKAQAIVRSKQIRFGKTQQIALHLFTRNEFKTKGLSATAESCSVDQLSEATRKRSNVKVAFVDHKLADNAVVRVVSTANVDASGLCFSNEYVQVGIVLPRRNSSVATNRVRVNCRIELVW